MSVYVRWLDRDHRVILKTFEEGWVWNDYLQASTVEMEMMDTVDHLVDVIADVRGVKVPEGVVSVMSDLRESSSTTNHPNGRNHVMVGIGAVAKRFADIYSNVFMKQETRMYFVDTMEDAYEFVGLTADDIEE